MPQRTESKAYIEHNRRQHLFVKYTFAVLIDLTVLNLFDEYCDYVTLSSFSISLLAAIILQLLLQITLKIEHKVAEYFKQKEGLSAKIMRGISTWAILFISKLAMLKTIEVLFPVHVHFTGPIHGAVAFIAVIIVMILAEQLIVKINKSLRDKEEY